MAQTLRLTGAQAGLAVVSAPRAGAFTAFQSVALTTAGDIPDGTDDSPTDTNEVDDAWRRGWGPDRAGS
jgi:hypothetical protein